MWRNTESGQPTKTVAFADSSQKFYPFFFLNGRITALGLMGIISSTRISPVVNTTKTNTADDDDENESCKVCCSAPADCVLLPCGHVFFCRGCRTTYETKSKKECPMCRNPYDDVIEIAD